MMDSASNVSNTPKSMLDTSQDELNELEIPEILAKLPNFDNGDVLELTAGRYTSHLAKRAKSVTAVECMKEFYQDNAAKHANSNNVQLLCQDVTSLALGCNSQDFIFSNWLLMYLSDNEVVDLSTNLLKWLRNGGHLFFRESCFKQSGDAKRNKNPTKYRHPSFYINAFKQASIQSTDAAGNQLITFFELVSSSSVNVYRQLKQNNGQVCYLWKKVTKVFSGQDLSFQTFLDEQQYSNSSIMRYEKIFGPGYVSTGGQGTTSEFVNLLDLKKGQTVLDVGCGIGGGDFYMAKEYGVSVIGLDLSTNMIHIALERLMQQGHLDVAFEICDATEKSYPAATFDVIYSRDTLLHIADKAALMKKFFTWLKPGGQLLISDYCCGDRQQPSEAFQAYVKSRGYHLMTPANYGKLIEAAGFHQVVAQDRSEQFIGILQEEVKRTLSHEEEFVRDTSESDFNSIVNGWKEKIVRVQQGDQRWGLFTATKPSV